MKKKFNIHYTTITLFSQHPLTCIMCCMYMYNNSGYLTVFIGDINVKLFGRGGIIRGKKIWPELIIALASRESGDRVSTKTASQLEFWKFQNL